MTDVRPGASTEEGDAARLAAENERLRAERDELRAHLERTRRRAGRGGALRRISVAILVIVAVVSFVAASVGIFAKRNFLDTDRWVSRVGPLAAEPAVQDALSRWLTDETMALIDPAALFEEVLPERGQILAVPLANAVSGFVGDRIENFIESDDFQRLWVAANEQAHAAAVRVLRGESEVVTTGDGTVTINLVPVINEALRRVGEQSPEILGRTVDLPTLTVDDLPDAAITRLEDALDVDLGDDFGQITVYSRGRLEAAQDVLRMFERGVVLIAVIGLVAIAGALALSHARRRTLLQMLFGIAIGLVLVRRLVFRLEGDLLDAVRVEDNVPAMKAVLSAFTDPFLEGTVWLFGIAAFIAFVAVITAPYPWVVSLRRSTVSTVKSVLASIGTLGERARDEATVRWVGAHRAALQIGGVLAGLLLLWVFDLSWFGVLVVIGLVAAYEFVVARMAPAPAAPETTGA